MCSSCSSLAAASSNLCTTWLPLSQCWGDRHTPHALAAVVFTIIYPVGIPLSAGVLLYIRRGELLLPFAKRTPLMQGQISALISRLPPVAHLHVFRDCLVLPETTFNPCSADLPFRLQRHLHSATTPQRPEAAVRRVPRRLLVRWARVTASEGKAARR